MSDLLKDLYALMVAEYGDLGPGLWDAPAGDRWVMDLPAYKRARAACRAAGAVYPAGGSDDPKPEDRLFGLPIEIHPDGGEPHVVRL